MCILWSFGYILILNLAFLCLYTVYSLLPHCKEATEMFFFQQAGVKLAIFFFFMMSPPAHLPDSAVNHHISPPFYSINYLIKTKVIWNTPDLTLVGLKTMSGITELKSSFTFEELLFCPSLYTVSGGDDSL